MICTFFRSYVMIFSFIFIHLWWQICRRFVLCLKVIWSGTNHWERVVQLKMVFLPYFYQSWLIGFYDILSLYVFSYVFFYKMELIWLFCYQFRTQWMKLGPQIVILEGSIMLAIRTICTFAVWTLLFYFLKIVFRSVEDCRLRMLHIPPEVSVVRLSAFQSLYGKNQSRWLPLHYFLLENILANCNRELHERSSRVWSATRERVQLNKEQGVIRILFSCRNLPAAHLGDDSKTRMSLKGHGNVAHRCRLSCTVVIQPREGTIMGELVSFSEW